MSIVHSYRITDLCLVTMIDRRVPPLLIFFVESLIAICDTLRRGPYEVPQRRVEPTEHRPK